MTQKKKRRRSSHSCPAPASVTFGRPDLRTVYIGSLKGNNPILRWPPAGVPMDQQRESANCQGQADERAMFRSIHVEQRVRLPSAFRRVRPAAGRMVPPAPRPRPVPRGAVAGSQRELEETQGNTGSCGSRKVSRCRQMAPAKSGRSERDRRYGSARCGGD